MFKFIGALWEGLFSLPEKIMLGFKAWFSCFTTTGKVWLTLGLVALVVDAAISYSYGISLTFWHAAGFALVAVFFALLPDAAYSEIEHRRIASGLALSALCVPLGMVAFYSHLGYGAGVRMGDMQQTGVQNTKHSDARKQVEDNEANLKMWREHLDKLTAENPWAATVNPDGLKEQAATLGQTVDAERARGGCGPKCMGFMKTKADLEARIGVAEQASKLASQIEATQRKVDQYREASANVAYTSSAVVNQNNVAAQLFLAFTGAEPDKAIDPDSVTTSFTSIFIAGGGSLAFMIMAPVGFFVAGRNRIKGREESAVTALSAIDANLGSVTAGTVLTPRAEPSSHTVVQVTDRSALEVLAGLKKQLERQQQTRLAAA